MIDCLVPMVVESSGFVIEHRGEQNGTCASEFNIMCRSCKFLVIDAMREAGFGELAVANQRGLKGSDAQSFMSALDKVSHLVSEIQKQYYPRYRGKLQVALGAALLVSPTGRRATYVWEYGDACLA